MSLPILIQTVLTPIVLAPIVYLAGRKLSHHVGWLAFAILLHSTTMMLMVAGSEYIEVYSWVPRMGWDIGFKLDGLSLPFALNVAVLSTVIAIYSIPYMEHRIGDKPEEYGSYYALYLLYAAGMLGAILATDLVEFYIFYELMLIPSYLLIARWGYGEREKIAFMYFLWTHIGALALLASIVAVYWVTGATSIEAVKTILQNTRIPFQLEVGIATAMLLGFLVKMAVLGLHVWLPHAHAEAPTPISALLSPAMIGIGGYGVIRIALGFFPQFFRVYSLPIAIWAFLTMVYGGLVALSQDDVKRLLAYSSISQMGYLLFGISSVNMLGVSGSILHYLSHGLGKGILFMVAGILIMQTELRSISRMGGLASRMPLTAVSALIGFLTLIGLPTTSGFVSEWMIFGGVIRSSLASGSIEKLLVAVLGLLATMLTAGYGLWTVRRVFFGQTPTHLEEVKEGSMLALTPIIALAILTFIVGVFPAPILDRLTQTVMLSLNLG